MTRDPQGMSADEYTTDVAYPSAFGAFQAPVHMAWAAALGGARAPDVTRHFTYCDLGCGGGLTLCVLADCYPEAEFHGVDINLGHVAQARDLARRAGLANVTFHEASFANLDALSLPRGDFITMSGIYSWLPPHLRNAALAWSSRMLTGDGLLFLHYGALPGNSQIDALYSLIRETAAGFEGDSVARFGQAAALLDRLALAGAQFFKANPYAAAWLKGLPEHDQRSMAHEVLNAQPRSLSFADAQGEVGAHGLRYVANAQTELNHLELVVPPGLVADLAALSATAREMLLDTLRNASSRMDIYARPHGPSKFADSAGGLLLDRLTTGDLADERRRLSERTKVDFSAPVYRDLLREIDGAARTVRELACTPALAGYPWERVIEALQHLVAVKLLHVLRTGYGRAETDGAMPSLRSRLNRMLLEERIDAQGQLPLASPVAGNQVLMPPADRLTLLSLVGGDFEQAWERISAAGQRVNHGGKPVTNAAGLARVAADRASALGRQMIFRLAQLGIVS